MADFGEYLPFDGISLHSGSGRSFHNTYPTAWAATNRKAVEESVGQKKLSNSVRSIRKDNKDSDVRKGDIFRRYHNF